MLVELDPFFKVIVLQIGLFESEIVDERHFSNELKAQYYANKMCNNGYVTTIVNVQ